MPQGGFYVVAPGEMDVSKRYLISLHEGRYVFGPKSKASISLGRGKWTGTKDQDTATRLVDLAQEAAAAGTIPAAWANAQAETYEGKVIYRGGSEKKVAPVPTELVNANIECWDGTWRKFPVERIKKVFRGYSFTYAFVDAAGTPRGDVVSGETKMQIVKKINDPDFPIYRELVLTFSPCTAEDLAVPQPEPEHVVTLAEINSVPPMSDEEFDHPAGGAAVQAAKYATDPKYRLSYDRREYIRKQLYEDVRAKEAKEQADRTADLAKSKLKIAQEMGQV